MRCHGIWWSAFLSVAVLLFVPTSIVGDPPAGSKETPVVLKAEVPFYPLQARAMGLSGQAIVDVTTDGEKVLSTSANATNHIFLQPSIDNLNTWRFKKHSPSKFQVKYRYDIVRNDDPDAIDDNSHVIVDLPREICIRAQSVLLVHYNQGTEEP